MPLFVEPHEPEFIRLEARHRWVAGVVAVDYGEVLGDDIPDGDIPEALNWLLLIPAERRYDFSDIECGLAYISPDGAYSCTIWDATGEEDDPWAVLLIDDAGPRLLAEYSIFDENATEELRETIFRRAADEIPDIAEQGGYLRTDPAIEIPDWMYAAADAAVDETEP